MSELYPLVFRPIFKEKIWGGQKIKTILNKDYGALANCGETWELSGVKENISIAANGIHKHKSLIELIEEFKGDLVGHSVFQRFGTEFPLLIKFIDANDDLSIQVHPDDTLAKERHNGFGKTEMWYVVQADQGASLISGFNQPLDKENYLSHFNNGSLNEILNRDDVHKGDVYFIPAGRVHTIGKGLLIAEIQQTSDTTYRIYDFDRVDANGNKRELHVDLALDAIDYSYHQEYKTQYNKPVNTTTDLVQCDYFTTNVIETSVSLEKNYTSIDSFVIFMCLEGNFSIRTAKDTFDFQLGDVVLLPATLKNICIETSSHVKLLETYIA